MIAASDTVATQTQFELDVYGKRGVALARGEGACVWDEAGREYLDCIAGQGSANLGHCHPKIVSALTQQIATLMVCPGSFHHEVKARALQGLVDAAPASLTRGFLCNSGTESVEAALKFARIATGREQIIAFKRGFHGRTYGAMSATFAPKYSAGCHPLTPGFGHLRYNDAEAVREAVTCETAAVIVEIVQGEGGVHPGSAEFFGAIREACTEHGALLIVDEVQTGFGRTGKLFACEHHGLQPDILCLAKSIAGGFPMGATLVADHVAVKVGQHGSTFGGNPMAAAACNAALELYRDPTFLTHVTTLGERFDARMAAVELPIVRDVRRRGLMIGIELKTKVRPYLQALMDAGVLALPAGATVLRLLPPLVIEPEQWDVVLDRLLTVLGQ